MFVACYLPVLSPNQTEDPSRKGFKTKKDAWKYVFSQMCNMCKNVRQNALNGETSNSKEDWEDGLEPPNLYPACTCEWAVCTEQEIDSVELEKLLVIDI